MRKTIKKKAQEVRERTKKTITKKSPNPLFASRSRGRPLAVPG
jgi:hypothetical protein